MKNKPKIAIKEANKGKFTEYCKRKGYKGVTGECEQEGLASNSEKIRKQAQFSVNAKKWNKG